MTPVLVDMETFFSPRMLLRLASQWSNISKDQLIAAGVIGPSSGGSDWKRFNDDPMTFLLKLPSDRLYALCDVLNK
jgi:hypothetical protein